MFPSGVVRPKMLRIMAGMVQKDSCSGMARLVLLATVAPRAVFPPLSSGPRCSASWPVWTRRLGLLVFDDVPRAVLLLLSQAQDARLHGRHGPDGQFGGSQVQFLDKVFYMPVVVVMSRQCSTLFGVSAVAVHHGRRHSLSIRRGSSPWS